MASVILHWYRNLLEPFVDSLNRAGIETEEGNSNDPVGATNRPGVHLIWGCPSTMADAPGGLWDQLRRRDDVWFAEQGWFPQKGHFYIDRSGPNGYSSLRGKAISRKLTEADRMAVARRIEDFHAGVQSSDGDFIFVPLQVEVDSNISRFSNIPPCDHRVRWFVQQVCEAFPDHKIVFRMHPLERRMDAKFQKVIAQYGHAELNNDGTAGEWCAEAKAVVGINSTVLLEALTYGKPVLQFGEGIASGNGVVLEARGDVSRLRDILTYRPDAAAIERFLHMLFAEQIPINVSPEDFDRYPSLSEFVRQVRAPAVAFSPPPVARTVFSVGDVYGFLEYPDMPTAELPGYVQGCLRQPGVRGVVLNDLLLEEWQNGLAFQCRQAGQECIPMYSEDLNWPHMRRLERAKQFSGKIALGNCLTHEWAGGRREARAYLDFARKHGFEWVCTLTHNSLVHDMAAGGALRNLLRDNNILTFCLCGNVLLGYIWDEASMPGMNEQSLHRQDLFSTYGLTADSLRDYCAPLRIYSGAGGKRGLALGTRQMAQECGFKGVLCWMPFDLSAGLQGNLRPPAANVPRLCQGENVGIGADQREKAA